MFGSIFHRPLNLDVGDRKARFSRVQNFEFALSSRTHIPADRLTELTPLNRCGKPAKFAKLRSDSSILWLTLYKSQEASRTRRVRWKPSNFPKTTSGATSCDHSPDKELISINSSK